MPPHVELEPLGSDAAMSGFTRPVDRLAPSGSSDCQPLGALSGLCVHHGSRGRPMNVLQNNHLHRRRWLECPADCSRLFCRSRRAEDYLHIISWHARAILRPNPFLSAFAHVLLMAAPQLVHCIVSSCHISRKQDTWPTSRPNRKEMTPKLFFRLTASSLARQRSLSSPTSDNAPYWSPSATWMLVLCR